MCHITTSLSLFILFIVSMVTLYPSYGKYLRFPPSSRHLALVTTGMAGVLAIETSSIVVVGSIGLVPEVLSGSSSSSSTPDGLLGLSYLLFSFPRAHCSKMARLTAIVANPGGLPICP
ncbi:unnamed protein product [Linum trigynum]|uniref:Uncharacterized protein n=1 Tax=Linum trigynum TaxID=586398 RepID=A0AAV2E7D2_9ROSI